MNDILDHLNDAQSHAVTAPEGPVLVVAGAGTGKTRVLTTRVAWLMANRDVYASEILAFTFTNRAATEMKERVARSLDGRDVPFWIGTFHATGLSPRRFSPQTFSASSNWDGVRSERSPSEATVLLQVQANREYRPG